MKCSCGCKLFYIDRPCCEDCEHNGSWTEHSEYIYTELSKGAVRDQSYQEGECGMGLSYDEGCYYFTCKECGKPNHLPLVMG